MNTHLPYDYARCANSKCPQANNCKRYLAESRPDGPQAFAFFPSWPECDDHIPLNGDTAND